MRASAVTLCRLAAAGALGAVASTCRSHHVSFVDPAASEQAALPALDAPAEPPTPKTDPTFGDSGLAPLPQEPLFTNLAVPGFPEAVVAIPNGATSRRPVIVVLHGTADRPDWNCDAWRHITGARGFVLCPRGAYDASESTKDDRRFTLRGGATLRAHLDAALDALAARFAAYVDVDRPIVAGFSLGAAEIAQVAVADPGRFSRVAQVEGGHSAWTEAAAKAFVAHGGRRVLFACGSAWCAAPAKDAVARLSKAGAEARAVHAAVGHTTDRALQEAILREVPWFIGDDPRWAPF